MAAEHDAWAVECYPIAMARGVMGRLLDPRPDRNGHIEARLEIIDPVVADRLTAPFV